jgi:hypothetical protein
MNKVEQVSLSSNTYFRTNDSTQRTSSCERKIFFFWNKANLIRWRGTKIIKFNFNPKADISRPSNTSMNKICVISLDTSLKGTQKLRKLLSH